MAFTKTRREKTETRIAGMKAERAPYEADWEEIERLAMPSRSDYLGKPGQRRRKANTALQDTAGRIAGRRLINGMATGLSSSSMPWFKLGPFDSELGEYQPVKEWLLKVEVEIYRLFQSTNYYDAAKINYADLGHMGVSAAVALEHDRYRAVWHPLSVGEYWLGLDDGLRVSTLVRETHPTVDQLVRSTRDWSKLTPQVKTAYDKGDIHVRVPCVHVIEENTDRASDGLGISKKPWRSIKWEQGQQDKSILLSEGGYDSKPFTAPRWETRGSQVWSDTSPGFDALGDLRELQLAGRRKARAMDMLVKPPMVAPAGLSRSGLNLDPGTVTYTDLMSQHQVGPLVRPEYQAVGAVREDIEFLTRRVNELFYADLFMAISEMEGIQPRNEQELMYRNEEKLTQLGPVVDRVNIEKLEVDIVRAYTILDNLGLLPPPPRELEGMPLQIRFISILAQAQQSAANTAIERAARFVGFVAGMFPEATIKFDAEQAIDEFASNSGTSPKIIRSDEMVAKIKQDMQAAQQRQQMAEMAPVAEAGANAAKLLSETQVDPGGNSALNRLLGV